MVFIYLFFYCCLNRIVSYILKQNPLIKLWLNSWRLVVECAINYIFLGSTSLRSQGRWRAKSSSNGAVEKSRQESLYIDKRGRFRTFDPKKLSRKRCIYFSHFLVMFSYSVLVPKYESMLCLSRWFFEGPRMEIRIWVRRWNFSRDEPNGAEDFGPCSWQWTRSK